jgi:hypothetical protein
MADSRSNAGGTVSGSHVQTTSHASGHEQSFTPEALTGNPFARQDQPEPAPATSWKRLPHHGSDTTPRGESASTVASRFASGLSGHSSQPAMDAGNSPFAHVKRNPAPDNRARRVERDDNGRIISETPPAWTPPPEAENMHEGLWQMIGQ